MAAKNDQLQLIFTQYEVRKGVQSMERCQMNRRHSIVAQIKICQTQRAENILAPWEVISLRDITRSTKLCIPENVPSLISISSLSFKFKYFKFFRPAKVSTCNEASRLFCRLSCSNRCKHENVCGAISKKYSCCPTPAI